MKKILGLISVLIIVLGFSTPGFSKDTHSDRAVTHGSQASEHASGSAAHAIANSGQAVSGAASVPFMASGTSGAASAPIGEPLKVTNETITIGLFPDQALKTDTTDN